MRKNTLFAACAAAALLAGGGSLAQTAQAPTARAPAASDDVGTTIGEIVVTAEKREANLQEVPEAVTAFTAQDRNIKGISTVQDMTNFTPGLTYSSQLDRPAMRGLRHRRQLLHPGPQLRHRPNLHDPRRRRS